MENDYDFTVEQEQVLQYKIKHIKHEEEVSHSAGPHTIVMYTHFLKHTERLYLTPKQ